MKKLSLLITSLFFISIIGYGQTQQQVDSVNRSVANRDRYIDSALSKISVKEFQTFLYENVTVKQYYEFKFVELYNFYVQYQQSIWLKQWNEKNKKPK